MRGIHPTVAARQHVDSDDWSNFKLGEPWFVAKDVCVALELGDVSMTLAKLDADERAKLNLGQRGLGAVNIVNESGLYSIIMRSRKPEAKAFKKWVTSEVLPTIRKTGGYMAPKGLA